MSLIKQSHRHTFSIAPMIKCTDRYYRFFARKMSKHALLYTEMLTAPAIINGDRKRFLSFDDVEQPIVLQLGGSDPMQMAEAARIGEEYGYDEININCGCPSNRVQSGRFGACLMGEPEVVANVFTAMQNAVSIPVTVKTRIGIDEQDSYEFLTDFVRIVSESGCKVFIFHARKAWLKGLSPKQNREIPPLMHERVYQLKKDFPHLTIIINGGIKTIDESQQHLKHVDGVMLGREAYSNPYPLLSQVDSALYGDYTAVASQFEIAQEMLEYIQTHMLNGRKLAYMCRHYLGLFQGHPGARSWRQSLSVGACQNNDISVYEKALTDILNTQQKFAQPL